MERIATFEKVSYKQFKKDLQELMGRTEIDDMYAQAVYDSIKLPVRSTAGSAGYDFFVPRAFYFDDGTISIPTGIRCKIEEGWVLMLFPRSSLGFKHGVKLVNTTGIIDADYYDALNEGHIQCKMTSSDGYRFEHGERFMQGIFVPFGITTDDAKRGRRVGGLGSTGK